MPLSGALEEVGVEAVDAGDVVASFARHLMHGFYEWKEAGFAPIAGRWLERLATGGDYRFRLAENGDLLQLPRRGQHPVQRHDLRQALAAPSWLDPATGEPWL
jgi:hypothetical protein